MPRYFFHVQDGVRLVNDTEGQELDNMEAALAKAKRLAAEVRGEMTNISQLIPELKVEISDEKGTRLESIPLDKA